VTKGILASAASLVLALAAVASAQNVRPAGDLPRTSWGDPDLEGVWDYWTFTPLERPKEYASKPMLTDAEHAELLKRLSGEAVALDDRTRASGDTGAYSQEAWTDRTRAIALKQTSLLIDPPDGKLPPLTPEAQQQAAAHKAAGGYPVRMRTGGIGDDNPEDRGLAERCLLGFSTGPPFQVGGVNNIAQIVQTPDYVVLLLEMNHDARIVPLDGRPHLPSHIKTWLGDSRGRWEGNTLIIESTNFTPKVAAFSTRLGQGGVDFGSAEHLRLTERLTRVDAQTIEYEFTVDDPSTFARSFTGRFPMNRTTGRIYEYACHEGNYGLENILRAGRAEDATAAAVSGARSR
jgi:hypothetical protein